jgi:hypothetical protein
MRFAYLPALLASDFVEHFAGRWAHFCAERNFPASAIGLRQTRLRYVQADRDALGTLVNWYQPTKVCRWLETSLG